MASRVSDDQVLRKTLDAEFEFLSLPPGQASKPCELDQQAGTWMLAEVPGTVASARRRAGQFEYGTEDFDDKDHWYRARVCLPEDQSVSLRFNGLASLADVFWNDDLILSSDNMFHEHSVDMKDYRGQGILTIRFRSVRKALTERKPRARWRTRLVDHQQLRWIRTTLLGHIPAWCPPVSCVGPFRSIEIETHDVFSLETSTIKTELRGQKGFLKVNLSLKTHHDPCTLDSACVWLGQHKFSLPIKNISKEYYQAELEAELLHPELWWPHTHGQPKLYPVNIEVHTSQGSRLFKIGHFGFRSIEVNRDDEGFALHINGIEIFCRGACWTPTDLISLGSDIKNLRKTLAAVKSAGMNMIRVGGTMIYESSDFYQTCDELGIMVWQDFMFANMDYPFDEAHFKASVTREIEQFLDRTQASPSLTVFCGNSEIEQQTAMLGLAADQWSHAFFQTTLPELCRLSRAEIPYLPSSPSGGVMPFQVNSGVSHYYGVGAYQRPLDDARRARVRFTSECLGFSHIPDQISVDKVLDDGEMPCIHPKWKARVPRDQGAGWDFEDIRDHYLQQLFQIDPRTLRYSDSDRYLALARATTGELIFRTIAEWRRVGSSCKGALIWLLRDMWLGAGWGLIDADGRPKAAYYYAQRSMAPQAVFLSDEGLNGLDIHMLNERQEALTAELELLVYRQGHIEVASCKREFQMDAHSAVKLSAQSLFSHFIDFTYAYRFGPASHDLVLASLKDSKSGQILSQDWYLPQAFPSSQHSDLEIEAFAEPVGPGLYDLIISSKKWAQSLVIDVKSYQTENNYFHLAPGMSYRVRLTGEDTRVP
ncbi:MAG: glycoside hydrolase family 2 protein, partial [Proteobacteria bacterium]|nr:glycoside hydrolase family 2 protein [Pseudomonadota bacterium]